MKQKAQMAMVVRWSWFMGLLVIPALAIRIVAAAFHTEERVHSRDRLRSLFNGHLLHGGYDIRNVGHVG
jgi:hypothetical protein